MNKLIMANEGCRLKAYLDIIKVPTIGYGNTYYPRKFRLTGKVKMGDVITQAEADSLLETLLASDFNIERPAGCTDRQYDALQDLAYNIGMTAYKNSTLCRRLKNGSNICQAIREELPKFHYAGGRPVTALLKRRERAIQYAGCNQFQPA